MIVMGQMYQTGHTVDVDERLKGEERMREKCDNNRRQRTAKSAFTVLCVPEKGRRDESV